MTNGMVLINKPEGMSSARVVAQVKKIFQVKKAGHTGTLDPFATGLLPVALGQATRLSRFFLGGAKRYRARVRLGVETDTYDRTGKIVNQADPDCLAAIDPARVKDAAAGFRGKQSQVAPSFSALKHQGQPLYKLARQGKMIQKPARPIEIFSIRVTAVNFPEFELDIHCSGGTYIRSLAHDMGAKLGCGAHLAALCRTGVSHFTLDQAHDLEALSGHPREHWLVPMTDCLSFLPGIQADEALAEKIGHGGRLSDQDIGSFQIPPVPGPSPIRVTDSQNRLIALIEADPNGTGYNYCCVFNV
ncbi:MAG: tRNA pseudouridine(55) synthase TruB [Desulfotignum sp.]